MNVVGWVLQFGDVERVETATNRLRSFLLYSLATVHQIGLHIRV